MATAVAKAPKKVIDMFTFRGGIGHQAQGTYDVQDIIKNLQIDYMNKYWSGEQFVEKFIKKVRLANQQMQEERISLPDEGIYSNTPKDDYVFKYGVKIYGRSWK
jgi:hypothetical protein